MGLKVDRAVVELSEKLLPVVKVKQGEVSIFIPS